MKASAVAALAGAALLAACGNTPPAPDWQIDAHGSLERGQQAFLSGNARVAEAEYARARRALAGTARVDLLARFELARCASRTASLQFEPCVGYESLAADAAPAERAYAAYLAGRAGAADAALLAEPHRGAASQGALPPVDPATLTAEQALARLVAAAVLLQTGKADPAQIESAVAVSSSQGWRRPLLAWLGVQAQRAEQAGDRDATQRIRRRMGLLSGG